MRHIANTPPSLPLPLHPLDLLNLPIQQTIARLRLPWPRPALTEHELDLLNRLARRLGVRQPRLDRSAETQHAEDDECFPADVVERGRDEEADGEIEEPVRDAGERHARRARLEGPHFCGVDPRYGREGERVDDDEEVAECDDGVRCVAAYPDHDVEVAAYALRDVSAVGAEHAADDEHADAHADGAVDEEGAAAGTVDEEEGAGCEEDEQRVLYAGGYEVDVS